MKHGAYGTPAYIVWCNMLQRCYNPKNDRYSDWGGRGIVVCDRWKEFKNFLIDMGQPPEGLQLDREDNDGPYCKSNCRWATRKEQAINTRVRKDNKSGLKGVSYVKKRNRQKWVAFAGVKHLYCGYDFFEACCARKHWELYRDSSV